MAAAPISYGNDYAKDQSQIDRARQYAALMQQQSAEGTPTQVINGWAVPNGKAVGISKAIQGITGGVASYLADKKQTDLAAKQKLDLTNTLTDAQKAYMGTPETSAAPQIPLDDEGNQMPNVTTNAVAGDPMKYANILMQNPQTQQMGMQAAQQAMQQQRWASLLGGDAPSGQGAAPGQAAPTAAGGASPTPGGLLAGTGIDMRSAQASLLADPTGKELMGKVMEARMKANEPILQREGDVLRRNPDGSVTSIFSSPKMEPGMLPQRGPNGQVTGAGPIPGYGAGIAGIKGQEAGAVAGAQAPFKMVTINTPQGPKMVTEAQAMQMAGGGQQMPQQGPQPSQQLAGLPPQMAQAIQADMAKSGMQNANFRIGPMDAPAGTPVAPQNVQSGQVGPQGMRPQGAPTQAPAGPGIALQGDAQKAYETARAGDFAKQASTLSDGSAAGSAMLGQLQDLERIYKDPNIAKGALAENISGLKNIAASAGIDIKGLSSEQAAQALTNKMALDFRNPANGGGMPGAMSDSDRNYLSSLTPNLSKTPEGRAQIIGAQRKLAQRQVDIGRMATQYEQQHGQLDVGFQKQVQEYAASNPLFNAPNVPGLSPEAQAVMKKYGR